MSPDPNKSKQGRTNRRKGKDFECKIARILTQATGAHWKRGIQSRFGGVERPDVYANGLPYHIECKVGIRINVMSAMEQASRDAPDGFTPVVVTKRNRDSVLVTMHMEDWLEMFANYLGVSGQGGAATD